MEHKKYCCYQITNKVNGKFYRGKSTVKRILHGYFGSGVRLWEAIEKYGRNNFEIQIIKEFDSEEEAFSFEKSFVVLDLSKSYNLKPGGKGGTDKLVWVHKGVKQMRIHPSLLCQMLSEGYEKGQKEGHLDNFRKASLTEETCRKRTETCKNSGWYDKWHKLMVTPEIKEKASKNSLQSRKESGSLDKWVKAGREALRSPETQEKRDKVLDLKHRIAKILHVKFSEVTKELKKLNIPGRTPLERCSIFLEQYQSK